MKCFSKAKLSDIYMVYTVDPGYRHTAETIVLGGISIMVCTKSLNGRRIATIPILKWVLHQCGNLGGLINSNSRIGRGTKISDVEYLRLQLQQDYLICMTCSPPVWFTSSKCLITTSRRLSSE
ncbi:hypothetical protein NPIL_81041 [Nephila pilipes]|uniref:Uncharacterized protein n=1 Tax=Nephila pilipes TaxID=299642 RepID=A0A8X6N081_NEPPI|nr:hypothetical protein NPIL_81041 [Nephila pilipes]